MYERSKEKTMFLVGEDVQDMDGFKTAWENFWKTGILKYTLWAVSFIMVIFVISAGFKIATANSPEEKQGAKKKLISLAVGYGVILLATVLVTVFESALENLFTA